MSQNLIDQKLEEFESVERQLIDASKKINQMSKTIDAQAKKLAALELQLQKEQIEKQEIQRDYCHVVDLVQELRAV